MGCVSRYAAISQFPETVEVSSPFHFPVSQQELCGHFRSPRDSYMAISFSPDMAGVMYAL